jgi:hypothetical protein
MHAIDTVCIPTPHPAIHLPVLLLRNFFSLQATGYNRDVIFLTNPIFIFAILISESAILCQSAILCKSEVHY